MGRMGRMTNVMHEVARDLFASQRIVNQNVPIVLPDPAVCSGGSCFGSVDQSGRGSDRALGALMWSKTIKPARKTCNAGVRKLPVAIRPGYVGGNRCPNDRRHEIRGELNFVG